MREMAGLIAMAALVGLAVVLGGCGDGPGPSGATGLQVSGVLTGALTRQGRVPEALTGKIAFASDRSGNYDIYVMNEDGTGVTRLTRNAAVDWDPTWAPDGTKIAFASDRPRGHDIYVMNADGTGVTRLTRGAAYDYDPAWSPDGSRIAFARDVSRGRGIYVMNADGTGLTRLTRWRGDYEPAWCGPH